MPAMDWQEVAEAYALNEFELFPLLDSATQTAMFRVVVQAFKSGALAGFMRAEELRREVMEK